uniref:Protein FMC1 homolog n=1 Tax=Syphacia muris TaxID=451379 RepID=A0A0N5A8X6_9BILA
MSVERSVSAIPINFTRHSPTVQFIMEELRYHKLSQRVLCKAPHEMEHLAAAYKDYLTSTRQLLELEKHYQSGERTVAETANLVGLAVPEK